MSKLELSVRDHKNHIESRHERFADRMEAVLQRLETKMDGFIERQENYNAKRDKTMFGEKGDNGLVGDVGVLKTQQKQRDRIINFLVLPVLVLLIGAMLVSSILP